MNTNERRPTKARTVDSKETTMKIERFTIDVAQEQVDALASRLAETRWAPERENDDWSKGVGGAYLRELADYWRDGFDWRAQEAAMNALPQFRAEIDGVPVHFFHLRGTGPNPVPIILTHGWPWSFWDFKEIAMLLTDPAAHGGNPDDSFDVVIPSLPGFAFSGPLDRSDIGYAKTAELWVKLMAALGYDRFVAHGGDAGAFVTAQLGHAHRESIMGVHMSFPILPGVANDAGTEYLTDADRAIIEQQDRGPGALVHVLTNSFQPQTFAWAMHDSPVGLAAWLLARRRDWSDSGGDVETKFSKDTLLTHFSLYWFTESFIGSQLFCRASGFPAPMALSNDHKPEIDVPTAVAALPHDLLHRPRGLIAAHSDLRQWTIFPRGGHFGAAEEPTLMAKDIRSFVAPLRRA